MTATVFRPIPLPMACKKNRLEYVYSLGQQIFETWKCSSICAASSRVGDITSANKGAGFFNRASIMGNANAPVFPDPATNLHEFDNFHRLHRNT
jgi:hypothetical protein